MAQEMNARSLAEQYEIPVDVVVIKGHYGQRDDESLSEGEKL